MADHNSVMQYPVSTAQVRPFRIYHEQNRKVLTGKCFGIVLNAHNAAMVYARWYLNVGDTVAVLNSAGIVMGQYTRKIHSVGYMGPENLVAVEKQQRQRGA